MPEIGQVERCSSEGIKKESLHNAGFQAVEKISTAFIFP
ncbi:hypothetical protein B4073_1692 [Bacillus subtilis]|nr:hypothetical protein B4068_1547 [Bacillus subtilis]KIN55400.1 hypothetical protein B4073_1692 [Bacillus subtilis]